MTQEQFKLVWPLIEGKFVTLHLSSGEKEEVYCEANTAILLVTGTGKSINIKWIKKIDYTK